MKIRQLIIVALLLVIASCEKKIEQEISTPELLNKANLTSNKSLVNTTKSPFAALQNVGYDEVKLLDGFLKDRLNTAIGTMIPEMWANYSSAEISHALENFKIAAGVAEGEHSGAPFHDGDFYKLIEAASMAYGLTGNEKFNQMIDEVIPLIAASQRADGYIHTPVMIQTRNNPETAVEFRDRMDFESYNMGHLMTAATVHYKTTGKTQLLEIAKKAADYLYTYTEKFPEKMAMNAICPSHYMGVVEMYRTTGDPKYLQLAKDFIDIRSLMKDGTDHNQDRIPFREQTQAVGHAVRANYLYAGIADVYAETGDQTLLDPLNKIWDNLTTTKLYITGGCGALYDGVSPNGTTYDQPSIQQVHQAYGREYQLPNAGAHNETCANIGSMLWNWRMLQTSGESRYADLLESTFYNSVLSGVNLDGKGYFYTNPLSHQKDLPFKLRWPNVREPYISYSNCCPPNTIRTITEIPNYLYSKNDSGIWLNMFAASELSTSLGEDKIKIRQQTSYPWNGSIVIEIIEAPSTEKSLNFRKPDWCSSANLYVNDNKINSDESKGYISETRIWKTGDIIVYRMDMPAQLIEANPLVEETRNQVAVRKGPLVYCLEANDLPTDVKVTDVVIPTNIQLNEQSIAIGNSQLQALTGKAEVVSSDFGGKLYRELNTKNKAIDITLIPHFAWANREEADMAIWLAVKR